MKSIALKLWLGMMALVLVVLILLWLFQIVFLNRFYVSLRISEIEKSGFEIIEMLEKENVSEFQNQLDALAYNNNLTAELYDSNGRMIFSSGESGQMMMMMMNSIKMETLQKAMIGESALVEMMHPRFKSKYVLMGLPIGNGERKEGILLLTFPLAPVQDTVDILKKQLLYISIILLITAVIISYLMSRTFTKPIRDITKVSLEMASGNLSARSEIARKDEIGELARTINHMGQELSKVDQLRKDFIANVSHELRTPLSLIQGYSETIRDVTGDDLEKREKQLDIIIEESNRLSKIVEDILNLSQMQAGYVSLNSVQFNLNELIDKVVNRFEILSKETGVVLKKENFSKIAVFADENRIEQVFYNLIQNAFNHTVKGETISIDAREGTEIVVIEVADTGEGIPKEDIDYIWDRFYKLDQSGERKSGTGLGLTIVKNILISHQCNYGVKSQVGVGTTFWFELKKC